MWAYLAECDKLLVHTRQVAIENINTIDECRSKIVRNKSFQLPFVARMTTYGN